MITVWVVVYMIVGVGEFESILQEPTLERCREFAPRYMDVVMRAPEYSGKAAKWQCVERVLGPVGEITEGEW